MLRILRAVFVAKKKMGNFVGGRAGALRMGLLTLNCSRFRSKRMRNRVCLVDDEWYDRKTLSGFVSKCKGFELAKAYSNGEDALQDLPKVKPDLVLMDIRMPGIGGIRCLEKLRRLAPPFESCVLMLTEYENVNLILDAFRAGANGYLAKANASQKEMEQAMLDALAGRAPMSPGVAQKVLAFLRSPDFAASHNTAASPARSELTPRQTEIHGLRTQGLRYKEIAEKLHISEHGVHKHIGAINQKLHRPPCSQ
jgi:DNA-binding NarL/FixJ family response regulator